MDIAIWPTSALPKCLRCPILLPSHKWSTVVGQHQNWISTRAVSRVIFTRLHAQFTRFLSISLIYPRYSRICAHKMFTRRPPHDVDSTANDRSKLPRRKGRLMREEWNKLWDVLVVCWSPDPLDRPTASELEANLRKIFQNESWSLLLFFPYIYYLPGHWIVSTVDTRPTSFRTNPTIKK